MRPSWGDDQRWCERCLSHHFPGACPRRAYWPAVLVLVLALGAMTVLAAHAYRADRQAAEAACAAPGAVLVVPYAGPHYCGLVAP